MTLVTRNPSTVVDNAGAWTTPENSYASDDARASVGTAASAAYTVSGFDFASVVPDNAIFTSLTATIEHHESATTTSLVLDLIDGDANAIRGSGSAVTTTVVDTVETVTVAPNPNYTTPTIAQIRSANLQLRVTGAKTAGGGSRTINVDHVYLTLDYSLPTNVTSDDATTGVDSSNLYARPESPNTGFGLKDGFFRPFNEDASYPALDNPFADAERNTKFSVHDTRADDYGHWASSRRGDGQFLLGYDRFATINGRLRGKHRTSAPPVMLPYDVGGDSTDTVTVEFTWTKNRNQGQEFGIGFNGFLEGSASQDVTWVGVLIPDPASPATQKTMYLGRAHYPAGGGGSSISTAPITNTASRAHAIGDRFRITMVPGPLVAAGADRTVTYTIFNVTLGEQHAQISTTLLGDSGRSTTGTLVGPVYYKGGSGDLLHDSWEIDDLVITRAGQVIVRDSRLVEQPVVTEDASKAILGVPYTIELWENGVFVAELKRNTLDESADVVEEVSFDASLLSDKSGKGVEIRVYAGTYETSRFNIEAAVWDAQFLVGEELAKSSGDSSTSAETTTLAVTRTDGDSGAGTDSVFSLDVVGDQTNRNSADSAAGADAESLAVTHTNSDLATSVEDALVTQTRSDTDAGTGVDAHSLAVASSSSDTGTSLAEVVDRLNKQHLQVDSSVIVESQSLFKEPPSIKNTPVRTLVGRASFDLQ